ncbi:MAG: class I SAM-dependent methyltransferase [Gaiellaceae bacterium]
MPTSRALTKLARKNGAYALAVASDLARQASQRLTADGEPDLAGDRWVEWSFCMARLADGPGTTLDFGADIGFLSLAAAQHGHQVVALDREEVTPDYRHPAVEYVRGDILDRPLEGRAFDQIINCSSVEHVGLSGRYGSSDAPDGDIEAMAILRDRLAADGRMILTIPVGRDLVCPPYHRVYGEERLPRLLDGYTAAEEQYWRKDADERAWVQTDRPTAVDTQGSASFYSLGLFVLRRA